VGLVCHFNVADLFISFSFVAVVWMCLLPGAMALVSTAAVHSNEAMRKMVINIVVYV